MSDAANRSHQVQGIDDAEAVIDEASRLVARDQNVSASAARRLIRNEAFASGRFVGFVAHDITEGRRIGDDWSP